MSVVYKNASAFLAAGPEDLVGIAGLQAASLGVPVITFRTEPCPGEQTHFFWGSENTKEIGLYLNNLVRYENQRIEYADKCKRIRAESFSVESMVASYLRIYTNRFEGHNRV